MFKTQCCMCSEPYELEGDPPSEPDAKFLCPICFRKVSDHMNRGCAEPVEEEIEQ